MKIGIFTDGYLPGITGVSASVEASARMLTARGHFVYIVAPKYPKYQDEGPYPILRLQSVAMPTRKNIRVATYVPGTSLILANQLDLDIIHGHAGGPISMLGLEVARIKGIPYVFTYHTMFNQYVKNILRGKVITPGSVELATRLFCNSTTHIIAPTEKIKLSLLDQGVKKPITILPTGIDLDQYHPQSNDFLHQHLNLPADTKIILYLGRLAKEKSVDLLIKAFAQVANKQPQAHLVIVGEGGEKANLQKLAHQLHLSQRIHFTGFIDPRQTPQVYSSAYLSALPSITETQGLTVPESIACGAPTLVAKDKAFNYAVKHRRTGLIASNQTATAYAKQLLWALNNPDQITAIRQQGLTHSTSFSLDHMTDQLENLYHQLLAKKQPKSRLRATLRV